MTQLELLPEPPAERARGDVWPQWPNVRRDDYGQVEARAVFGHDPRQWATKTLEVLGEDGRVRGLRVVALDWSDGTPRHVPGTERDIDAQLVLIAMGFEGPMCVVFEALGVACDDTGRHLPLTEDGGHRAALTRPDGRRVFVAGDCRTGSSLVVSAIADGMACAGEVADCLGLRG